MPAGERFSDLLRRVSMLSHVLRTITRHQLLGGDARQRVLCAVSGGPDSMALLACLWELAPRLNLELEVATVDHGLRPEAAAEMALVAERAADLQLPWHALRVDVAAARAPEVGTRGRVVVGGDGNARRGTKRGGIQETARKLRFAALTELASKRGCARIALGHNADDQTETILFRLLRGTGLKGLAGIPYRRELFVRPMLEIPRAQILSYLARRSLPYVTDPSNADLRYARARLRHRILPLLRQENPRVDRALRSLAWAVRERAPQSEAVQRSRKSLGVDTHVPAEILAEIQEAALLGHGTRTFDVPRGQRITVSYGRVTTGPRTIAANGALDRSLSVFIPGPGIHALWGDWELRVCLEERSLQTAAMREPVQQQERCSTGGALQWTWFEGAALSWPLVVRARRPGDRMRPRGGAGSRKLSDLLIDAKIPRSVRAALPVVESGDGRIILVRGLRPSETEASASAASARSASGLAPRIGLAIVLKSDHDALVDHSILKGNTERRSYQDPLPAGPETEPPGIG